MALLGNKFDYMEDEQDDEEYQIPAVFRRNPKELSLKKSIFLSSVLHPTVVFLVWLTIVILTLLGIKVTLFDKPQPKPKDIEFVLVNKEATPINKHTKFRADRNSRAGGKHNPKRRVSMPQAAAPKSAPAHKASASKHSAPHKAASRAKSHQTEQKAPSLKKVFDQVVHQHPTHTKSSPAKSPSRNHAAPGPRVKAPTKQSFPIFAPRPTANPAAPRPIARPKSDFAIPVPKSAIPRMATPSGGPITSAHRGGGSNGGGSSSGGRSGRPSPSFSPVTSGSGSGSASGSRGGRFSGSYGSGRGNLGNPGPGNPRGPAGIDAVREPDFGPYMRELQRRIKMNWEPPKGNESKRVVLLFSISRDGRLLHVKVLHSSGLAVADKAAISAVQLTAPFKPLPGEYRGNSVDIQFTFDYNVFSASRY